jgi:hypothetical protein
MENEPGVMKVSGGYLCGAMIMVMFLIIRKVKK